MVLYTPAILALSVELAAYPLAGDLALRGQARSRVCGSTVTLGCTLASDGTIAAVGALVSACAIGQASAALFLRGAVGRDAGRIVGTKDELATWLAGEGAPPDWPGMAELDAARAYPSRHPAMLLPWMAALDALSNTADAG